MSDILSLENTVKEKGETPSYKDKIRTGYSLFWTREINVPSYFQPLVNITGSNAKHLPLKIHEYVPITIEVDGEKVIKLQTKVCRKSVLLGEEDCPWCKTKNHFNKTKLNRASDVIVFPVYMFSLVGRMGEYEKDGQKVEYPLNPVTFLAIKRGTEDNNIMEIIEDDMSDVFLDTVYSIKKKPKEAKEAMRAIRENAKSVAKKLQHLPEGLEIPKAIKDNWASMTKEQVRGLAANCYGLFTQDAPKRLLELAVKPEAVPEDETPSSDVAKEMDG